MILCVENLLDTAAMSTIARLLPDVKFASGAKTAGWHARLVKKNEQAQNGPALRAIVQTALKALKTNDLVRTACLPLHIRDPLLSRCGEGMGYGRHVDNATMDAPVIRTDLSVTIFLSPPETYEGGELVIEQPSGEEAFKLSAGSAVIYPTSHLHRVETVTSGERLALVVWIQSMVRDAADREMLFTLDQVRRSIFSADGKSADFDRLSQVYSNLLRKWADI